MADIIYTIVSGVSPKIGSSSVGNGGIFSGGKQTYSQSGYLPGLINIPSGYETRFDNRLIEGIKVKVIP